MRKSNLIGILVVVLFLFPLLNTTSDYSPVAAPANTFQPLNEGGSSVWASNDPSSGTAPALPVSISGQVSNGGQGLTFDSSSSGVGSVTLTDGWTGTDLQAQIDSLQWTAQDLLTNGDLNDRHDEQFIIVTNPSYISYNSEIVRIPDGWSLVKNAEDDLDNDYTSHPNHGAYELVSHSAGYGSTWGIRLQANWGTSFFHNPNDEIYIRQMVSLPWREVYSADISFRYNVDGINSNLADQVHLFARLAGSTVKFHVFESGDTTDTWLTASATINAASMANLSTHVAAFDIGIASDLSGQTLAYNAQAWIDEIQVDFTVRPFPEQIDLKANGTLVWGSTTHSVYPYVPDDDNRDCYDDNTYGLDLDGYPWGAFGGVLDTGIWHASQFNPSGLFETGMQFPLDIPQGAIITSAYLEVQTSGGSATPLNGMRVHVAAEDNVSAFTTGGAHLEDRYSWVEATMPWDLNSWVITPTTRYRSPEIGPLVQNVISRPGWSEGNYILIMTSLMNADYYQRWNSITGTAGYDGNDRSRLFVEYIIPEPDDTIVFFDYQKTITIDHTNVVSDLVDFPVLIDLPTDSDLSSHVLSNGSDIAFTIDGAAVPHEIEFFDQASGKLVAWVKVPYLSSSTDTVITMHYGCLNAPPNLGSRVWNDYEIVQHLGNDPTGINYDSTTNNHDGTSYDGDSTIAQVSGKIGDAVQFDGFDDVISVGQIYTDEWSAFTVSAWINHDVAGDDRIFSKAPSTTVSTAVIHLAVNPSDLMRVRLSTDQMVAQSRDGIYPMNHGSWYYLSWTWDAVSDMMYLYVNGSLENSVSWPGNTVADSDIMFIIGNWETGTSDTRHYDGAIDEIRMLPTVRSAEWIETEFNNQNNPAGFYTVGSQTQISDTWTDAGETQIVFTTTSSNPVSMDVTITMDVGGEAQTMNTDFNEGVSYFIESGASIVNWTAKVMVSPPAGATAFGFTLEYPRAEWKPTTVLNPINQRKTVDSDWWYHGGTLTLNATSIDFWGVWTIKFISWNFVQDVQLSSSMYDINDLAKFTITTPTVLGARAGLNLIDPAGNTWFSSYNQTITDPSHRFPSFRYRKDITIPSSVIYGTVTEFPVLIQYSDDTDLHDTTKVRSDGSDILFADGDIVLDHEIEYFNQDYTFSEAKIVAWVKMNLTLGADKTISMYYGSPVVDNLENPEGVWSSGFDAVWHLGEDVVNEASGAIHSDSSGNGYDGVQNGNVEYISGRGGYAQDFDGIDDYISISDQLTPQGDVFISGWFRIATAHNDLSPNTQVIMEKFIDIDHDMVIALVGQDYGQGTVPNGSLVFKVESSANSPIYKWTQRISWNPGWYYIGCYADEDNPSNNVIWVNQAWDTDAGQVGTPTMANMSYTEEWRLGGGDWETSGTFTGWFDGQLDEFRVASVTSARSTGWLQTEYRNQVSPSTFAVRGSEQVRTSPEHTISKTMDSTAPAGLWTVEVYYNDTGTTVTDKTGLFEATFTVRHPTALSLQKPSVTTKTVGDALIVEYQLTDTIEASGVAGATVTMNWTSPSTITLDDYGNGRYGKVLETTDLGDAKQWRIDISSSHPYYNDDSDSFTIDLYHDTLLDASGVTATPAGYDFTATLAFTDDYTGSPITGATITLDGSGVSFIDNNDGTYDISIPTGALSLGNHMYIFNATKAGAYLHMGSVQVTFTLREHITAVTVSGDLTTPYGDDTPLTVLLMDLDTRLQVDIGDVASFNFTSSYGQQILSSLFSYDMTLVTDTWSVGTVSVTLTVTMSNSDIGAPAVYTFNVIIRPHRTSLTVTGVTTQPYGNQTPLTIILTDLDTGGIVPIGQVTNIHLAWTGGSDDFGIYAITLGTSTWSVGVQTVTVTVTLSSIYQAPTPYNFDITIRSMTTLMYHEPYNLLLPQGQDFVVYLRLNVSEAGPFYSDPIQGRIAGEFSVSGYTESIDVTDQVYGRYKLTINALEFTSGTYDIRVNFNSLDNRYKNAFIVIRVQYRDIFSYLSSPNYPQVVTPYQMDVQILLNYTDADFGSGIEGATITGSPDWIANQTDLLGGIYSVWIDVSLLSQGTHYLNLTAELAPYEARTLRFRIVIREAYTSSVPSVGSLDIPIGSSRVFYVDYTDIDRLVPIDNTTVPYTQVVSTWGNYSVIWESGRYKITFYTSDSDTISQNIVYSFTFSKGVNYKAASFNITVSIRTHNTDFRIVSSIVPTSTIGVFNLSVYYGDLDNLVGIKSLLVDFYVNNASGPVSSSYGYDLILGDGFYIIQVPASQFGLGLQTFTVYADWTGAVAKYQDKSFVTTANVVGRDSALTLLVSSEPTPYDENMEYIFFYSDLFSGIGIDNLTGYVFVYVSFQGESATQADITLTDLSATQPGNYSIFFDTNIFSRTGLIYMNVFVNWSKGVSPFYSNRTDVISVRVLPRDTLLSINPPSPVSFGESTSFTFTYEDITGGSSSFILDDPSLSITSNITFGYIESGGTFTFNFDTTQFGAVGTFAIRLNVNWNGIPFYTNRTGRIVYISIINRVTFLEYLAPAPTQYLDEVIFNVTWTDITGGASDPITGATVLLYDGGVAINSMYYSVFEYAALGIYRITLNTTFVSTPGTYVLGVSVSIGTTGIQNVFTPRDFNVRERLALLAAEPISTVPYNSSINVILYYQDLFTTGIIGNDSADVTLEIINGPGSGPWFFTVTWRAAFSDYQLSVETYNLGLQTGVPYTLTLRMSYAYQVPFYSTDELIVQFQVRNRVSSLSLDQEPDVTPYGDNAVFSVFFSDVDAGGSGIVGATITIPSLAPADYDVTPGLAGIYVITVDSSALGSPSSYPLSVHADWFGAPYHTNKTREVTVIVRERETNIDVTIPPAQTLYLDDVTFTFQYLDLDASSIPITSIAGTNIHLYWANMSEINSILYTVTPTGTSYEITIASDVLSTVPISGLSLSLQVDWNSATAPYYRDDSTIVKVTITGRSILVETDQVDRTPKGDIVNISLSLTDLDNGNPIVGAIIQFSCQGHSLLEGIDYTRTEGAGVYTFHVDSLSLSGTGTFFFDIAVQWNPSMVPFYSNRSTTTITGLVDLVRTSLTVDALVPSSVQFTGDVSLLLTWRDLDHNLPLTGYAAVIEARVKYLVSGLPPAGLVVFETPTPGVYNVSFNTSDLLSLGAYTLDITVAASVYSSSTVTPQFSVIEIRTDLIPLSTSQLYNWTDTAYIYVDYKNLLDDILISGATVSWSIGGVFGDYLDEPGVPGQYRAIIDTSSLGFSGTRIVQISASLDKYTLATTQVTLNVLALPSDIVIIDPPTGILDVSRGNSFTIGVSLNDTTHLTPIDNLQVQTIYATFRGIQYPLTWDSFSSLWVGSIPGVATILDPGSYDVQITAGFFDYQVAGDLFRINIGQTETLLEVRDPLTGFIITEIDAVYSEVIYLGLNLTEKANKTTVIFGQVFMYEQSFDGLNLTFTYNDTLKLWVAEFNTSLGLYGTWGLTFRAFPDDPILASSTATVTLTIKKIETEVWAPTLTIEVDWGWADNISFTYYDTSFGRGIDNASVTYDYGPFTGLIAYDLGNGTYMVFINTTYLTSNAQHRIILDLQKQNYQERTSGANMFIKFRSTELLVSVDDERTHQNSGDVTNLQVPMGDSITISFFFNDTSDVGGLFGGLDFATIQATLVATDYFPGSRNVTGVVIRFGVGLYSFVFDTNDLSFYEFNNFEKIIESGQFFLTVRMEYPNRISQEETVRISIIKIPTVIQYTGETQFSLLNGDQLTIQFTLYDTWHNQGVEGVPFQYSGGNTARVILGTNRSLGGGVYEVKFEVIGTAGDNIIRLQLGSEFVDSIELQITITANPNETDILIGQVTQIGLPISLLVITLLGLYVRVWSVPKRIRQINGQIKTLRKGKVPKPVSDVKSRQALIADLFNDTYEKMKITRTAQQMPEESIPIEVPEMGELLMQLAILTNLSAGELEEFKADIVKMKMSEQAAFVKEVIMQEAIRAARREGSTVEEIIEKVEAEARRRLGAEEAVEPLDVVDTGAVETVFLEEEEKVVTPKVEEEVEEDTFEEVTDITSERMSLHEIEELRKDLERRGVPPYEIDTIIEQAKELPRDLVEELVKSLEDRKG